MRHLWLVVMALFLPVGIAQAAKAEPTQLPIFTAADRMMGRPDAPITIIEYASLTCPHCAAFDIQILPRIKQDWIDTGKAKLVFRDFPLDGLALRAAALTRCVPPERYFRFVDFLFKDQTNWARMNQDQALERAGDLGGLSKSQREGCLSDAKLIDAIVSERLTAEKDFGVNSTPTFFINGTKVTGDQPYAAFDKVLNAALSKR